MSDDFIVDSDEDSDFIIEEKPKKRAVARGSKKNSQKVVKNDLSDDDEDLVVKKVTKRAPKAEKSKRGKKTVALDSSDDEADVAKKPAKKAEKKKSESDVKFPVVTIDTDDDEKVDTPTETKPKKSFSIFNIDKKDEGAKRKKTVNYYKDSEESDAFASGSDYEPTPKKKNSKKTAKKAFFDSESE